MIAYIYLFGCALITLISIIIVIVAITRDDVIINNTYITASEEDRQNMDKKAYRIQTIIFFMLLALLSLSNVFRLLFNLKWITYVSVALFVSIFVFYIVSSQKLKNK